MLTLLGTCTREAEKKSFSTMFLSLQLRWSKTQLFLLARMVWLRCCQSQTQQQPRTHSALSAQQWVLLYYRRAGKSDRGFLSLPSVGFLTPAGFLTAFSVSPLESLEDLSHLETYMEGNQGAYFKQICKDHLLSD